MDAGEQITLILVLIVVLGAAYFAITIYSKRAATQQGEGSAGPGGVLGEDIEEDAGTIELRSAIKDRDHAAAQREKRFNLQGKDAEMAAKVLKRMLKHGREGDGAG